MIRGLALALLLPLAALAQPQAEAPNSLLLVAKPELADPNFRRTVVLVTQTADASTVGVILNRPGPRRDERTGSTLYFGGPVMREVVVALYRSERPPEAAAFHVLPGVYLTMHPRNLDALRGAPPALFRLYEGFSGWAPGQLQGELVRGDWFALPASEEILFREDTRGLWDELVQKARARVATR